MATKVHTTHVVKQKVKVTSIFKLFHHFYMYTCIYSVEIENIEARPIFMASEPITKQVRPDVVAIESDFSVTTLLLMKLVKKVIFGKLIFSQGLGEFKRHA